MQQAGLRSQLTDASMELHGDDRALVALVLPGAVPKLSHPALGRPVCRPAVHQTVHHQDADHRIRVPVHCLARIIYAPQLVTRGDKRDFRSSDTQKKSFGKMRAKAGSEKAVPWVSQQATINSVKATTAAMFNFLLDYSTKNDPK